MNVIGHAALIIILGIVIVVLLLLSMIIRSYKKVPPNQAMIIYGFGGRRVVQGGGAFVVPGLQNFRSISMTLMSFDVVPEQPMFSLQGIALTIEAVAQIKIKSDPRAVLTASEQFLDRAEDEKRSMILHSVEGHLRGIVGQLAVESILKTPDEINSKMRETCAEDLDKMGLEVVSFTIKKVMDAKGYIDSLGVPEIERVRRDASIAKAEAERDIAIRKAEADKSAAIALASATQQRVEAESAAQAKESEYQKELQVKQATFKREVELQRAEADLAYELQQNKVKQQIITEQVRIAQVEAEAQAKVREAEIAVREKELAATVVKPAEAEKQAASVKAEAEKIRLILQAEAEAESVRKRGEADAAAERARGEAKAQIARSTGFAEAEALEKKAVAYKQFTEAAVMVELLRVLPELAERIARPLTNVDKITVISQDGATSGVNKVTGDIAKMIAQVPELAETLTGYPVSEMLQKLVQRPSALQVEGKAIAGDVGNTGMAGAASAGVSAAAGAGTTADASGDGVA